MCSMVRGLPRLVRGGGGFSFVLAFAILFPRRNSHSPPIGLLLSGRFLFLVFGGALLIYRKI